MALTRCERSAIAQSVSHPIIKAANGNALFDYVLLPDFRYSVKSPAERILLQFVPFQAD